MRGRYKIIGGAAVILLAACGIYAFAGNQPTTQAVTIRGIALSETGEEFKVEREEDVAVLVETFENAERTEGPVKAIGNNLTFTFHLENGDSIEYPVWQESSGASFEDPTKETVTEEGDVRFQITDEDWEEILKLIEENR